MTVLSKLSDNFSETRIDDEIVVMRLDTGEFLSLTDTGSEIWQLIDGTRGRDDVVAVLAGQYDAPADAIGKDVDGFLDQLRKAGLIAGD